MKGVVKRLIRSIPVAGNRIERLYWKVRTLSFRSSRTYWESRYGQGGNSGAGSIGRLASFKAQILNQFVADNGVRTVIEFGCGDGSQLRLAKYPSYVGIDVSQYAIDLCAGDFATDATKKFYTYAEREKYSGKYDLVLSIDVIYHLVEDGVFQDYMRSLFDHARKFLIIYSSNHDDFQKAHMRHREFTKWIDEQQWELFDVIRNKYPYHRSKPDETSLCDFYFFRRKS